MNDRRTGGPATSPETSAGTVSRETGLASAHRCTLDRPAGTKGRAREDKEEGEPGATGEGEVVAGPGVGASERLVGREGRGRAPGQRRREGEAESRGAISRKIAYLMVTSDIQSVTSDIQRGRTNMPVTIQQFDHKLVEENTSANTSHMSKEDAAVDLSSYVNTADYRMQNHNTKKDEEKPCNLISW